jgi:putative ABC transport system ATP-binding protein
MISIKNITKNFTSGDVVTHVLRGINLEIPSGQFVSIVGASGAGKSTLLYQMSLLDTPTSGTISVDGKEISTLDDMGAIQYRLENFGFVFQDYALVPELTALENVTIIGLMQGADYEQVKKEAIEILTSFNLAKQIDHLPSQLSGGEQQRVSVARAIIKKPKILFADEPTASLDSTMSAQVIDVLISLNKKGQTIVMVTHEEEYARLADRIVRVKDGQVVDDQMTRK